MSNFFSDELHVATQQELDAPWSCGKPGEYFRCGFCGHKFKAGDYFRVLYTSDMAASWGNPLVCSSCNDSNDTLRDRWASKHKEWKILTENRFWWFVKHHRSRR